MKPYLVQQSLPSRSVWHKAGQGLLDLLFPPRCAGCDRMGDWFCADCQAGLDRLAPPLCPRCGSPAGGHNSRAACLPPSSPLDCLRSVAYFGGGLRSAIHRFKYQDLRLLARPLGELMAQAWEEGGTAGDLVLPVPLHPIRLRERGYNQSALLAREVGRRLQLPVAEDGVQRIRHTRPQVDLGVEERRANVHQAFAARSARVSGRRVILVDDVLTSGATLEACAAALRQAGARTVCGFTLARARVAN